MKILNLLLGNSDRRVGNLIETLVRDVCDNYAIVHCTRTARVDEFIYQGCHEEFDLVILASDSLLPAPGQATFACSLCDGIRAMRARKNHSDMPIIAVGVSAHNELPLADAGVDCVLGLPFGCEELKEALRNHLSIPAAVGQSKAEPLSGILTRVFQRLTQPLTFSKSSLAGTSGNGLK
jgi:DNA-binding response OmpR family regulator